MDEKSFTVSYGGGDYCDKTKKIEADSKIIFICDYSEEHGWPELIEKNMEICSFEFQWKSQYACRQCLKREVSLIEEPCVWNQRTVQV